MEARRRYYRRRFEMHKDIQYLLDQDCRSEAVDRVRKNGNALSADGLTIRLADEFGFCYRVDRAVDYAFQARERFPDRNVHITGGVVHNPTINWLRPGPSPVPRCRAGGATAPTSSRERRLS